MHSMLKGIGIALALAGAGGAHAADPPAVTRALAAIGRQPAVVQAGTADRFHARDVIVDADGTEHVRLARTFAGLPVIGGDVVVHSRGGTLHGASQMLRGTLRLGVQPTLAPDEAIARAGAAFGAAWRGTPTAQLVVYARGPARLAYRVALGNDAADMTFIVDAHSGALLDRWSDRHTAAAAGTARTLYAGDVPLRTRTATGGYELFDPGRGGTRTIDASNSRTSGQVYVDADNVWGDYTVGDPATAAADAQYGASVTWDYFRVAHGRLGIAGDGRGARSRVHYGRRYSNAFWNDACFCMTYGDGDGVVIGPLVSLDIAGHEMAHGVTSRTAGLIYSGESGGLNEATSDIFGAMVEFHARNAHDTPDYLMGEEIVATNVPGSPDQQALRFMFDPSADGRSPNCWTPAVADLDVHYSSGIGNRFFYLLAEGSGARRFSGVDHTAPTCDGGVVAGIGRVKARAIWYRALTVYFTSTTDYAAARVATLQAAADLYGAGSADVAAVAAAWSAVDVH